jgi:hypothetical protein
MVHPLIADAGFVRAVAAVNRCARFSEPFFCLLRSVVSHLAG